MFAQVNIDAQNINIIAPFNLWRLEITMAGITMREIQNLTYLHLILFASFSFKFCIVSYYLYV
jgi:hypothetical protein